MSKDRAFDYQQQAHKPVVHYIKTADEINLQVGSRTLVFPIDHPSFLVSNNGWVLTSTVIAIHEDGFETENTIYKLK
jgi:hypothetical protein